MLKTLLIQPPDIKQSSGKKPARDRIEYFVEEMGKLHTSDTICAFSTAFFGTIFVSRIFFGPPWTVAAFGIAAIFAACAWCRVGVLKQAIWRRALAPNAFPIDGE